jgi:hypothetical protein
VVPCNAIEDATSLQTGAGETSGYLNECAGDCPGRRRARNVERRGK